MLEMLGILLFAFVAIIFLAVGLIALPLMIIATLFKVLFFVLILPFRLLAVLFGVLFGAVAVVGKAVFLLFAGLMGVVLLVGGVLAIPLIPLLVLGLGIWLLAGLLRPRQQPQVWHHAP